MVSHPGASRMLRPRHDGQDVVLTIDPGSERLQRLEPWPAWDGRDFIDMPVLVKTKARRRPTISRRRVRGCAIGVIWTGSATTCSWVRSMPSPALPVRAGTC